MSKELELLIRKKIAETPDGAIPFSGYMEMALYHPVYGYYSKPQAKVGKKGDFYTSTTVHPVFAEALADQVIHLWEKNGMEQPYLIEVGGGTGHLLSNMLLHIKNSAPAWYERLQAVCIESSPYHRERQQERLAVFTDAVRWYSTLAEAEHLCVEAVIISNEWFDAFPVCIAEKQGGVWRELGVIWNEESSRFEEAYLSCLSAAVREAVKRLPDDLPESMRIEVNPYMEETVSRLSNMLSRGIVLTIDYGDTEEELYHPARMAGTITCYQRHQSNHQPLFNPGEQDITAHVNFSAIAEAGNRKGLTAVTLLRQDELLTNCGILTKLVNHQDTDPFTSSAMKRNRAILQLIASGGMGGVFKCLVQTKNAEWYTIVE